MNAKDITIPGYRPMTHNEYTTHVEKGEGPLTVSVPLDPPFVDDRGSIQNLILKPITSVASIISKKGSIRANHYHKTDMHYAYIVYGSVLYFEREIDSKSIPEPKKFTSGSMFYTPPNVEHCMLFPEDTCIITMARNVRSHESHEADLVRVEFITRDIAAKYL